MIEKIRTIITQDAEVDDRNSLRHFLLYANEVEVLGIIQTSSKFHWKGIPGAVKPEKKIKDDFDREFAFENGPYDAPYRWPGTEWMWEMIDHYEIDYPNLCRHAEGYPTPEYLRSIIKIGNIGYEGEVETATEGSDLIKMYMLDEDSRPLYIQIWGGTNTVARALMDIEAEYSGTAEWQSVVEKINTKVVLIACGEQDPNYQTYVAEKWPKIQFVKTLQIFSYAYPWFSMPDGESKDSLRAEFMQKEILNKSCALTSDYCTWLDGQRYPGEAESDQFGTNEKLAEDWFKIIPECTERAKKYDFLSEGDSPTYLCLLPWGLRTLENFANGGICGRYEKIENKTNSKGELLNYWDVTREPYMDRDGNITEQESMWKYVCDIQRDFASRVDWAGKDSFAEAEHAPTITVKEGLDLTAEPGMSISFSCTDTNPDGIENLVSAYVYSEAGAECSKEAELIQDDHKFTLAVPASAKAGDRLHVIVRVQTMGHYKLARFAQVIVTVK